jgi:hypothetical protein
VVEDIRDENTLFTVANRTGHPAIITVDTISQVAHKLVQIGSGLTGFGIHLVTVGNALSHQFFDGLSSACRLLGDRQCQAFQESFPCFRVTLQQKMIVRINTHQPDEQISVLWNGIFTGFARG